MSDPGNIVSVQVARMLELTEEWSRQRCTEVQGRADQQVRKIIHAAYQDARIRLRTHFQAERREAKQRLVSYEAVLKTRQRQQLQQQQRHVLTEIWRSLHEELVTRWQHPEHRTAWIQKLLLQASDKLPRACWTVAFPAGLDGYEVENLSAQISRLTGIEPNMSARDDMLAGIRIITDGVTLDATPGGLLSDSFRIESEMLALYNQFCLPGGVSEYE